MIRQIYFILPILIVKYTAKILDTLDPVFRTFEEIGKSIIESIGSLDLKEERSRVTGMGADGTNTHFIDKIAEDILMEIVKSRDLPYNIISEEIGQVDRGYGENLIVDPVDGTYNAINGIPFYSISIAIGREDTDSVSHAFVMNLGNKDIFRAEKGKGSFLNGKSISVCTRPKQVYGLNLSKEIDPISENIIRNARRTRILGCASLEMCLVACGSTDILAYTGRHSKLRSVDVAAGALIVREAGGIVTNESGEHFNSPNDVTRRFNLIAASSREVLGGIL